MNIILGIHIASGVLALPLGTIAVAARKGGPLHVRAGTGFFASMLVLAITAAILEAFRTTLPGSPVAAVFVCYLVLTAWVTARRRDGRSGRFEIAAGAVALMIAAASVWDGFSGRVTPEGPGPVFVLAALCLIAGLLDLSMVRRKLSPVARIARHLWRMCFAFFIAIFSFLVQPAVQDLMPAGLRGSPVLLVLAFVPLAVMAFWLVRVRFGKRFREAVGPAAETRGPSPAAAEAPASLPATFLDREM
jgi:hypothetical protein